MVIDFAVDTAINAANYASEELFDHTLDAVKERRQEEEANKRAYQVQAATQEAKLRELGYTIDKDGNYGRTKESVAESDFNTNLLNQFSARLDDFDNIYNRGVTAAAVKEAITTRDFRVLGRLIKSNPKLKAFWSEAGVQEILNIDFSQDGELLRQSGINLQERARDKGTEATNKELIDKTMFKIFNGETWELGDIGELLAATGNYDNILDSDRDKVTADLEVLHAIKQGLPFEGGSGAAEDREIRRGEQAINQQKANTEDNKVDLDAQRVYLEEERLKNDGRRVDIEGGHLKVSEEQVKINAEEARIKAQQAAINATNARLMQKKFIEDNENFNKELDLKRAQLAHDKNVAIDLAKVNDVKNWSLVKGLELEEQRLIVSQELSKMNNQNSAKVLELKNKRFLLDVEKHKVNLLKGEAESAANPDYKPSVELMKAREYTDLSNKLIEYSEAAGIPLMLLGDSTLIKLTPGKYNKIDDAVVKSIHDRTGISEDKIRSLEFIKNLSIMKSQYDTLNTLHGLTDKEIDTISSAAQNKVLSLAAGRIQEGDVGIIDTLSKDVAVYVTNEPRASTDTAASALIAALFRKDLFGQTLTGNELKSFVEIAGTNKQQYGPYMAKLVQLMKVQRSVTEANMATQTLVQQKVHTYDSIINIDKSIQKIEAILEHFYSEDEDGNLRFVEAEDRTVTIKDSQDKLNAAAGFVNPGTPQ